MASRTGAEANRRAGELYTSTSLKLPKDAKMFQIKSDKPLRIDILPYQVGEGNPFADPGMYHYERTFWVHRGIGPDNNTYVCLREASRGKQACPICEHLQKLREDPDAHEDLIAALKPKRRQLFNVMDVNNPSDGVMIWDISFHLFGALLLESLEDEEFAKERRDWCEFEGGQTLRLALKEKTFNKQKFYEVSRIDFVERKKDYNPDDMLKKVFCLDRVVKVLSYAELKKVFLQTGEEAEGNKDSRFRRSDLEKIADMTLVQMRNFIIREDLNLEPDDFDEEDALREALLAEIKSKLGEDDKPTSKSAKEEEPKEEPAAEIEEGSEVTWDDDGDEKQGTVVGIKDGKKGPIATVEDTEGEEHSIKVADLTLAEEQEPEEPAEIEEGSEVTWTDDDGEEHAGEVLEIKGKNAKIQKGKKSYLVKLTNLTLA
jgi:hypothetical protein